MLEADLRFARALLDEAGMRDVRFDDVEVSTQVWTRPPRRGRRVDLELLALREGRVAARVWSENKVGAVYQPDQLPDYRADLAALGGRAQLITIVNDLAEAPDDEGWLRFTWRDVARWVHAAGCRADDGASLSTAEWRRLSVSRGAAARDRLLIELLSYLKEEHAVTYDPLTHDHVFAFARMGETNAVLTELVAETARRSGLDPDPLDYDDVAFWQTFKDATWAQPLGGYPELFLGSDDEFSDDRLGQPAFGAGITLPATLWGTLRAPELASWAKKIADAGFSLQCRDDYVRIYRVKYLAEVISSGATLDAQARALGTWLKEAVAEVKKHDPKVPPPPPRTKRKRPSPPSA